MKKYTVKEERGSLTDIRQSPGFSNYLQKTDWRLAKLGDVNVFFRSIPLLGSVMRIPRSNLPLDLVAVEKLVRETNSILVKIEPNVTSDKDSFASVFNFKRDRHPFLPTHTIWIDLTQSAERLWANLDKDTRNLVRRTFRERLTVKESLDISAFYKIWSENAKKKGFFAPYEKEMKLLWESFSERHLLVVEYEGKMTAAAMILGYKEGLYYLFAASNDRGRMMHAPYAVLWETIIRGKRWGYERLDLEGIEDHRVKRTRKWRGFTHFKKGFGGEKVLYIGSFSKYYTLPGKLIGKFL
jgi:lipid II:glycine glycyltransferase (peptidoglycan interpeptide bridge formation enzyme)